jgi:hypothetical protein
MTVGVADHEVPHAVRTGGDRIDDVGSGFFEFGGGMTTIATARTTIHEPGQSGQPCAPGGKARTSNNQLHRPSRAIRGVRCRAGRGNEPRTKNGPALAGRGAD